MLFEVIHTDITTLQVECIVNATNETGLVCNIPGHCIDSAIHLGAGPRLFQACQQLNGVPTGKAKITFGYDLHCKYIIHVTGPNAHQQRQLDYQKLSLCYLACLEVAARNNIKELAFCCISTGLFWLSPIPICTCSIQDYSKLVGDKSFLSIS